jgi:MFS family permease
VPEAPKVEPVESQTAQAVVADRSIDGRSLSSLALLMWLGWAGTNLGIAVADLPLKFLLKVDLHRSAAEVSAFFAIGAFTNYIKPLAGLLVDSVPLFRTRRRWYLIGSLLGSGILWIVLALVPRDYNILLATYALLYLTIVFTSTSLGGVMVEVGQRFNAAGRLTAQRISAFRIGSLLGGPIGGYLASMPFLVSMTAAAVLHLVLVPLYVVGLPEPPTARLNRSVPTEALNQFKTLLRSTTLLAAAFMIFLIAASPGFGTPLLFHQTDTLKFSKAFVGILVFIGAATGLVTTGIYYFACRKLNLRLLITGSIIVHALGTITYLYYHDIRTAIIVTAISGVTGTLTMLPVYDLAARGTPKGSEAIGYAVMMSVWNLTNALSDWAGSTLFTKFHLTFRDLVWVNAGTTLLVLIVVPFLPRALMLRRDGTPT